MKTIGDILARNLNNKIVEVIQVDQDKDEDLFSEITEYIATDSIKEQYATLLKLDAFVEKCNELYPEGWNKVRKGAQKVSRASRVLHEIDEGTYSTQDSWAHTQKTRDNVITVRRSQCMVHWSYDWRTKSMSNLNLLTEEVITLTEARNFLPEVQGQKRPHVSTVWRWTLRGVGGVKLETVKIGSRIVTSKQAVTRFISATSKIRS